MGGHLAWIIKIHKKFKTSFNPLSDFNMSLIGGKTD